MTGFPSLPTDNLYKFIALSGLFLVGLAFYLAVTEGDRESDRADALLARSAVLRSEQHDLDVAITQAEHESALANVPAVMQRLRVEVPEMSRRLEAQHSEVAAMGADLDALKWSGQHSSARTLYWPLLVTGAFMTCFGFVAWFILLQQPQDELLKIELNAARARANGGTPQTNDEQS